MHCRKILNLQFLSQKEMTYLMVFKSYVSTAHLLINSFNKQQCTQDEMTWESRKCEEDMAQSHCTTGETVPNVNCALIKTASG